MTIFMQSSFDVSRKKAAHMLNVSTRTLDRYLKNKVLSSKNIAGRIFLNREEVKNFSKQKRKHRTIKKTTSGYVNAVRNDEIEKYKHELETSATRIKQLETQLEASVMPEEYKQVDNKRKEERYNKVVLCILLAILLLIQPLWLLLIYF